MPRWTLLDLLSMKQLTCEKGSELNYEDFHSEGTGGWRGKPCVQDQITYGKASGSATDLLKTTRPGCAPVSLPTLCFTHLGL